MIRRRMCCVVDRGGPGLAGGRDIGGARWGSFYVDAHHGVPSRPADCDEADGVAPAAHGPALVANVDVDWVSSDIPVRRLSERALLCEDRQGALGRPVDARERRCLLFLVLPLAHAISLQPRSRYRLLEGSRDPTCEIGLSKGERRPEQGRGLRAPRPTCCIWCDGHERPEIVGGQARLSRLGAVEAAAERPP